MTPHTQRVQAFFSRKIELENIFHSVATRGASSAPIFNHDDCKQLLAEAETMRYTFTKEPYEQGKEGARVYQELETFIDFFPESIFLVLRDTFEYHLSLYAESCVPYPFSFVPTFNSATLARYLAGSIGITPHLDHLKYKNILCVFVLGGKGRFFVCADRSGYGAQEIDASVGNIIFLRCPGFMGIDKRPFHFITDISETRYSFILRQTENQRT